jgi:hypothetical protein
MRISRLLAASFAVLFVVGTSLSSLVAPLAGAAAHPTATTTLSHQLPAPFARHAADYIGPVPKSQIMTLAFGLPIRDPAGLLQEIKQESRTHQWLSHAHVWAQFAPTAQQFQALQSWLSSQGLSIS